MADGKLPLRGWSINPDDFTEGGLIDDVNAIVKSVRFTEFDYQGKSEKVLALHPVFTLQDGTEYTEQYYSAGSLKAGVPSADGTYVVPVGSTGSKSSSNAAAFLTSIVNAGFPKNKLADDVSVFDGMGVHLRRVAQVERKGLNEPKDEKGRPKTVLVVDKILWLPGETPTFTVGTGTGASKGAPAGAPPAGAPPAAPIAQTAPTPPDPAGEIEAKATAYIVQVLAENGGQFQKAGLPSALFKVLAAAKEPDHSKILATAVTPAWVTAAARPWKVDAGGTIQL